MATNLLVYIPLENGIHYAIPYHMACVKGISA